MAPDNTDDDFLNKLAERRQVKPFRLRAGQTTQWMLGLKTLRNSCDSRVGKATFL